MLELGTTHNNVLEVTHWIVKLSEYTVCFFTMTSVGDTPSVVSGKILDRTSAIPSRIIQEIKDLCMFDMEGGNEEKVTELKSVTEQYMVARLV